MPKSITIDDEAYAILKSHKVEKQSFSEVIKTHMAIALQGEELIKACRKILNEEKQHANGARR